MPLNPARLLIDPASLLPIEQSADANPGIRFTPADMPDSIGPEPSRTITNIDDFLAMFGTTGTESGDDQVQDSGSEPNDGDHPAHPAAGPLPDTGAAGSGGTPDAGSNPVPDSNPALPPGVPAPVGGQGQGQPAPGPANQVQPGPAEQIPQTEPAPPDNGPGSNPGSTPINEGTGAGSNPGAGGVPTPSADSGAGLNIESAGGAKPDASGSKGSSSSSSSSNGGGGGGFSFGGGGLNLGGGGLDVGSIIVGGGMGSVVIRGAIDGNTGMNFGAGDGRSGDQPVNKDAPPSTGDTGMPPVQPPAPTVPDQSGAPSAETQQAMAQREQASTDIGRLTQSIDDAQKLIEKIRNYIPSAQAAIQKQLELAGAATQTVCRCQDVFWPRERENKQYAGQIDALTDPTETARINMMQAEVRAGEAQDAIRQALRTMVTTHDPAVMDQQVDIIVAQGNVISQQDRAYDQQWAIWNRLQGQINALEVLVHKNEVKIAAAKKMYDEAQKTLYTSYKAREALKGNIAKGNELMTQKNAELVAEQAALAQARAAWKHANDLLGGTESEPHGGPHAGADTDGDIHMSAQSNVNLALFDATLPTPPADDPDDIADTAVADSPNVLPGDNTVVTNADTGSVTGGTTVAQGDPESASNFPAAPAGPAHEPAAPAIAASAGGELALQVEMVHSSAHPGSSTAVLCFEAVAHELPLLRAIVEAWMRSLPSTADFAFDGLDIVKPQEAGPVTLEIHFSLRAGHAPGANLDLPADAVAALKAAMQGVVVIWENEQGSAARLAAFEASVHHGTADMLTADSVMLTFEFSAHSGAAETTKFVQRSHDVHAVGSILAQWMGGIAPAFAATVVAFDIVDTTDHGDIQLQVLVNAMPVTPDPATLLALQNAMQDYLAAPEAPAREQPANVDATTHQALSVVGLSQLDLPHHG